MRDNVAKAMDEKDKERVQEYEQRNSQL